MKIRFNTQSILFSVGVLATGLLFQNCAQQYGVTTKSSTASASIPAAEIASTSNPVSPTNPIPPNPIPPTNSVCDPLQTQTSNLPGLQGELYWVPTSVSGVDSNGVPRPLPSAKEVLKQGLKVPDTLVFMSQINVPTRSFDTGFKTTDGLLLQNENGQTLFENFALKMETRIKLSAADSEGTYQIGVLSDDGVVIDINSGSGFVTVLDNDSIHATQMSCGGLVTMKKDVSLPMNFLYYQGPRYYIAAVMMWRKIQPGQNLYDSNFCGVTGSNTWFDISSQPTAKYNNLLAQGWKVLGPENFEAVSNLNQACAKVK